MGCISHLLVVFCVAIFCVCKNATADVTIEYLNIITQIEARFSTTIIVTKIKNDASSSKEVTFTAELPEAAFISNFTMFVNDKVIVGDVKEKDAAKAEFDLAKSRGESAGHVFQKPRETNMFQIAVNVGANSKAVFNLTYLQLLKRVHGVYKHIVNLQPDQAVEKVQVDVFITERGEITNLHVPKFAPKMGEKTNKELLTMEEEKNADIKKNVKANASNVQITFKPTQTPLAGQMVVLYDVERGKTGGDIEVVNGYFVHFIAPEGLKSGNKHIIFVLDHSGSMQGRKMEQLKLAMKTILNDLDPADKFNILMFSSYTEKWKTESALATRENVQAAQDYVTRQTATGSTALNDALIESIQMLNADSSNVLTSMVMFMTDGQPTEGEVRTDQIITNVDTADSKNYPIHSIAFGEDADYNLLKRISSKHHGLARKIYEDSDAALQMTGFFDEIRSPVLTELKVDYLDENVDITSVVQDHDRHYYTGGEVVVVGKLKDSAPADAEVKSSVTGIGASGPVHFETVSVRWICPQYDYEFHGHIAPAFWRCCPPYYSDIAIRPCCWPDCCWGYYDYCPPKPPTLPPVTPKPKVLLPSSTAGGFIERMWAYQSIKKLLKQAETNEFGDKSTLRQKALDLSLRYHFVTELTSMVVVDKEKEETWKPIFDKIVPSTNTGVGGSGLTATGFRGGSFGPAVAGESSKGLTDHEGGAIGLPVPIRPPIGPEPTRAETRIPITTTTTPVKIASTTTAVKSSPTGCSVNVVFVIDASGDVSRNSDLIRKTIDQLSSSFSQNTFASILSVSSDGSGKSASLHSTANILTDASNLKDSTRTTPSSYSSDLVSLIKDDVGTKSTTFKQKIVFFVGSQSLQYATTAVQRLKQIFSSLDVIAVTGPSSKQNSKDLESLAGSALNVLNSPQAVDLADSLKC